MVGFGADLNFEQWKINHEHLQLKFSLSDSISKLKFLAIPEKAFRVSEDTRDAPNIEEMREISLKMMISGSV